MFSSKIYFGITILLFGLVIKYLTKFYANVKSFSSGPIPLPLLGNLLIFAMKRRHHPFYVLQEIGEKYGKLYTFWIGSKPVIIILDLFVGKEMYNKYDFSGRPETSLSLLANGKNCQSFAFMNYGKEVQALRKVSLGCLRQLLTGNKFASVVINSVDVFVNLIKTHEINKHFSTNNYIKYMFLRIIGELSFGKKYEIDDNELKFISQTYELFNSEVTKLLLTDFIPITKYVLKAAEKNKAQMNKLTEIFQSNFEYQQKQYKMGSCDNMCESIITARKKLIEEGKEESKFLTDNNLIGTMNTLFAAGSDTSIAAFTWIIYLLSFYPEYQQKLRNEVMNKICNRAPDLTDKNNLHYVNAFISETLRFRNVGPIGLFHTTMNQTNIDAYSIPKNTTLILHHHAILNDTNYWTEPEKFNPERFFDCDQTFISTGNPAFIPFGTGRRVCVGEKMAYDIEFLMLTRLIQVTNGYQFVLSDEKQNYDLNPNTNGFFSFPKKFKLCLKIQH